MDAAMSRAKGGGATADDIAKVIRANVPRLEKSKYLVAETVQFVQNYESLLVDLAALAPRVTKKEIYDAACKVFDCQNDEKVIWSNYVSTALIYCKNKRRCSTTGIKLPQCVKNVAWAMATKTKLTLGQKLFAGARKLQREISSPSKKHRKCGAHGEVVLPLPSKKSELPQAQAAEVKDEHTKKMEALYAAFGETYAKKDGGDDCWVVSSQEDASCSEMPAKKVSFTDPVAMQHVVVTTGGKKERFDLKEGDNGFAVASVEGKDVETEVPNVLLLASRNKKPKKAIKKKPAAAAEEPPEVWSSASDAEQPPGQKAEAKKPGSSSSSKVSPKSVPAAEGKTEKTSSNNSAEKEGETYKENFKVDTPAFGLVKFEFYGKQSYLRQWVGDERKWVLLVNTTGANHQQALLALQPVAMQVDATKEKLVAAKKANLGK